MNVFSSPRWIHLQGEMPLPTGIHVLCLIQDGIKQPFKGEHMIMRAEMRAVLCVAEQICELKPDWVMAAGDLATLDAAKAAFALAQGYTMETLEHGGRMTCSHASMGLAVLPTTLQTATGVSPLAVVMDEQLGRPHFFHHPILVPDLVLMDVERLETLEHVRRFGLLNLPVAIEAYACAHHNMFTDPLCIQSIRLLLRSLDGALKGKPKALNGLMQANAMSCFAMSNSGQGAAHALAHAADRILGSAVKRETDFASIFIGPTALITESLGCERYRNFAYQLGLTAPSAQALWHEARRLCHEMNMPASLQEAGLESRQVETLRDELIDLAMKDACFDGHPIALNAARLAQIIQMVYEGV